MLDDLSLAADDFVSIDIEGDGNNPPSPVEICAVEYLKGEPVAVTVWLVNPGKPMSAFVQTFHGITDKMVADAPRFEEIAGQVRRTLEGRAVVTYAAKSDMTMLRTVMPDVDGLPAVVIDAQRMAKSLLPGMSRYRLESVSEALGLKPAVSGGRGGFHTAQTDAEMTAAIFLNLLPRIPGTAKQRRHHAGMAQVRPFRQRDSLRPRREEDRPPEEGSGFKP